MEIRRLNDADRPAIDRYLAPIEPRALFLVGNALQHGIDDRGGPMQGGWVGAFEGGRLVGLAASFRGPGALLPACGGNEAAILPALLEGPVLPRVVLGPAEAVDRALPFVAAQLRHIVEERLFVLRWGDHRGRSAVHAAPARPGQEADVAALIGALHREAGMPTDEPTIRATAERQVAAGSVQTVQEGGRILAMSTEAAATGRYLHVGATYCVPEARRRGLAGACVSAVLERARREGRASDGAALFTGRENTPAIRLYEAMGFRADVDWKLAFLATTTA